MCLVCGFSNISKEEEPPVPFDENDANRLINDVWIGIVTVANLPDLMYYKTAGYLMGGVKKGVKESITPKVKNTVAKLINEDSFIFGSKTKEMAVEEVAEKMAQGAIDLSISKEVEIASQIGVLEKTVIEQIIAESGGTKSELLESLLIDVFFDEPDYIMIADLTENIYIFSGAKTYQDVRSLTDLLLDPELKSNFYKFKEKALEIYKDYNEAYLQAEYQTALASSRMAAEWNRIVADADLFPLLEYDTVGDSRVRPTHAALDKICRPVFDKFWTTYYPPNGWRCRCSVRQITAEEGTVTNLQGWLKPDDVPPEFMMNSGQDKYIFKTKGKDKHPYFKVAKGDKKAAQNNFGFPIPK